MSAIAVELMQQSFDTDADDEILGEADQLEEEDSQWFNNTLEEENPNGMG